MSTGFLIPVSVVDVHQLSAVIRNRLENVLIIDSRSFIEHNACHISSAVNVCCSKIVKRRLQQDKLSVKELLIHTCHCDIDEKLDIVVYDESSKDADSLPVESFTAILLKKLQLTFRRVNLLTGGFQEFQSFYPDLCEDKTRKCPPLTSLSQPCLPIANQGPTRILPFLYLGSQFDATNRELLKNHNISYELNVSTTCPQPDFVQEGHFMRIPVNDTYSEKLLPYFPQAFNFLDKVREGNGCALVHCLAGISRSPTVAIAYVMRYLRLSSDDGYRYVKSKRPTISPNFNFLGQLLEYEKQLKKEKVLECKPEVSSAPPICSKKRFCRTDMRTTKLCLDINLKTEDWPNLFLPSNSGDQSPTSALAKLSFEAQQSPSISNENKQPSYPDFRQYRSKSCYGDWLRDRDDTDRHTSKVLSPVKEIKCDALISEISTSETVQSREIIKHRAKSSFKGQTQTNTFSQFFSEKHPGYSLDTEEIFSLQTLSHFKAKPNRTAPIQTKSPKIVSTQKFLFSIKDNESVKDKIQDSSRHLQSFHSLSSNLDKYARSSGTWGYDTDCKDNSGGKEKCSQSWKLKTAAVNRKDNAKNTSNNPLYRTLSPLTLPSTAESLIPIHLESPISPSESHLFEDLELDKDLFCSRTEPSSPTGCSFPSEDADSFHDSGVPLSPPWVWPRKRIAKSDAGQNNETVSSTQDKRKYEPFLESSSETTDKEKTVCRFETEQESNSKLSNFYNYNSTLSDDRLGLYRVQSCPGYLSQMSSFCPSEDKCELLSMQKKCFLKEFGIPAARSAVHQDILCHESCPDVLHLGDSLKDQPYRSRDFRRNVRMIQVS